MVLDESTLERMLATGQAGKEFQRPPAKLLDANDEFEVYERAAPQGVRETIREAPAPDLEEYPPRQHAPQQASPPPAQHAPAPHPAPPPPRSAAPTQAAPAYQAPLRQEPVAPRPEPAQAPVQQSMAPPAPAIAPSPEPRPQAPGRPQVFSLHQARPQPSPPPAPAPAPPATQTHQGAPRIVLVQADYNADVTDLMAQWAVRHAHQGGAEIVAHIHVPGVFDVPLAAKLAAKRADVDAVVVVGAVIQGETGHDELIAREAARLLADIAYAFEKPVGLGIAGPRMTTAQAEARIKMGRNAVESVLRQLQSLRGLLA